MSMCNSDSNLLEHCMETVKSSNVELSAEELKDALAAISEEVQKFNSANTSHEFEEYDQYKSKLQMKRKEIKRLKENLNTACTIAKAMFSAKENERKSLTNYLVLAKSESKNLTKMNTENFEVIQRLTLENHFLTDKVLNLNNFIELGFKELQKIRGQPVEENLSVEKQLKEIIVCCGQYYADYSNEHEKCNQLEQKNRYLGNKLSILETNLAGTAEELKSLQRRPKGKTVEKKTTSDVRKIGYVCSEYKFGSDMNVARVALDSVESKPLQRNNKTIQKQSNSESCAESLDLSSHMALVKNLITDQDTMLQDLRKLTEELGIMNA